MAELVTGHAGKAHATAEQAAGLNAGILGLDDYVLDVHDKLKITVVSANKVTIGTGELVMQGRHVSQGTPEDLIVTNGSQGQKRNDLIVCRYAKGSQNIESAKLVVVRGTPTTGTPTDPAVNTTSPLDGGTTYDMPLYRIPLDGITIGTPVALFNVLRPMSDVWDSLTHRMVNAAFKRSDGQLAVNNGQTLMNVEITEKTIPGAYVTATSKGGEIRGLEPGTYLVFANLPLTAEAGWYALSIDKTGNGNMVGTPVGEQLLNGNGYTRLNAVGFITITSETDGIWLRIDSNHDASMRSHGSIYIIRI
ncbi:hypothetical protein GBC42_11355 [Bifidobacterium longum]|nr:hypothetical protein GBC42_11355 [Bifidobacterium longum]